MQCYLLSKVYRPTKKYLKNTHLEKLPVTGNAETNEPRTFETPTIDRNLYTFRKSGRLEACN